MLNVVRADDNLPVVFLADRMTMQAGCHAPPAVTTLTREDCEDDEDFAERTEFGREFRIVPAGVHHVHANLSIGNLGLQEYAAWPTTMPKGSSGPSEQPTPEHRGDH
ncbi:DUF6924 domain-containing protein [Streptomyces chiangmaiensis]|uniref:DUF6924 domain-containing protein n=1 Tax=Streptomyces chiangmaiensis TaxID=766497 RepID=A0ABU7FWN7_9ACTN|nr:hypothetical protein [Streptomyces chiangmaiensis]MED7828334.1 hypothetical protein [Streptomyces chiangmaiensis]